MVSSFFKNNFGYEFNFWLVSFWILGLIILAPIFSVFFTSLGKSHGLWQHLIENVLLNYISNTLILMIGVSILVTILGVSTAWIVSRFLFFGSKYFELLLLLPAACPAYLIAYVYTDFFDYSGIIQVTLRSVLEFDSAKDYWFPEIRSLGGAIFIMSFVLYPYVYILSRVSFLKCPPSLLEVAELHNKNSFLSVGFPLARPAIIAGVALVCMEVISDFGTVEFFTVNTLTLAIFNVWIGMNNLAAAAQIAIISFIFIIALISIELRSRSNRKFFDTSQRQASLKKYSLRPTQQLACFLICLIPVFIGFILPISLLIFQSFKVSFSNDLKNILNIVSNSLLCSFLGAILIIFCSSFIAFVSFYKGNRITKTFATLLATGYAFPGIVLAIGVLVVAGKFDKIYSSILENTFNIPSSGMVSGTLAVLLFAYLVRFNAIGYGAIYSGISQIPENLMEASYTLGKSFSSSVYSIIIPLMKTSFLAGGILAFVDIMKELPMTLLLRPFNFETLATYSYQFAHDELFEQAALPALIIIIVGLIPIIFMNRVIQRF